MAFYLRFRGRAPGWALVVVGVINTVAPLFLMHMREVAAAGGDSLTDTMHAIVTAANVIPSFVAMGFSAWAFGKGFRLYAVVTLAAVIVFGVIAGSQGPSIGANEPTRGTGSTSASTSAGTCCGCPSCRHCS